MGIGAVFRCAHLLDKSVLYLYASNNLHSVIAAVGLYDIPFRSEVHVGSFVRNFRKRRRHPVSVAYQPLDHQPAAYVIILYRKLIAPVSDGIILILVNDHVIRKAVQTSVIMADQSPACICIQLRQPLLKPGGRLFSHSSGLVLAAVSDHRQHEQRKGKKENEQRKTLLYERIVFHRHSW